MSYPTIEDKILDDGRISEWLAKQIVETRDIDTSTILEDVKKLEILLNKRIDRQIRESKTFKTRTDLNSIDF